MRTDNKDDIMLLRQMVEQSVSRKMKAPSDFQFLTGVIQERCKETLCVATLKRIWGYVEGKNARVGSHSLLQGIFPPRDQTLISCTTHRFFTIWATREDPAYNRPDNMLKEEYSVSCRTKPPS